MPPNERSQPPKDPSADETVLDVMHWFEPDNRELVELVKSGSKDIAGEELDLLEATAEHGDFFATDDDEHDPFACGSGGTAAAAAVVPSASGVVPEVSSAKAC